MKAFVFAFKTVSSFPTALNSDTLASLPDSETTVSAKYPSLTIYNIEYIFFTLQKPFGTVVSF
jgi:hypothetical protein